MGQQTSTVAVGQLGPGTGNYLSELGNEVVYDKSLGQSRLLKSIRAVHRPTQGRLVVKVRSQDDPSTYERFQKQLTADRDALDDVPNALPYQRVVVKERSAMLLRQWVAYTLYDRISTRPFLTLIEKKWIAFQLLTGLRDIHARNVSHGDIKSENVLCTSANWIYLADFAPFKPTFLPLNDPADFAYFFDASGRRTCNLAPERFYEATATKPRLQAEVTEAMDVFSLGCVIAEICSDGVPPFTLSQLFKYRSGEYEPDLARIDDPSLKALVQSMLARDPDNRLTCADYLVTYQDKAFPSVFYQLYPLLVEINEIKSPYTRGPVDGPLPKTASDDKLERLWSSMDVVAKLLTPPPQIEAAAAKSGLTATTSMFPVKLTVPGLDRPLVRGSPKVSDTAALILLSIISAHIRNCAWPSSMVKALDLLLALSPYLTDEIRLDRVLPYMMSIIDEASALVKSAVLRNVTQLLLLVNTMTPSNAEVFTEYLLPRLMPLSNEKSDILVRCTFAQCLPSLAEAGARLLDLSRGVLATRAAIETSEPTSYDAALSSLQSAICEQAVVMLVDPSSVVRRALLAGLAPLCLFLGRVQTADVLLSHAITYLNDPDWALRAAFYKASVGLAACVGGKSVEQVILPLMLQAFADVEEAVVAQVLNSLTALVEIGLVPKSGFWNMYEIAGGLIAHPNSWIRHGAADFVAAACLRILPAADVWCTLYPTLRPLLRSDISVIDQVSILNSALPPLPRAVLDAATAWAKETGQKSPFWTGSQRRSSDDLQQLRRLLSLGPSEISEKQLLSLRLFILKRAGNKSQLCVAISAHCELFEPQSPHSVPAAEDRQAADLLRGSVSLQSLGVTPQNVFFGTEKDSAPGKGPTPSLHLHEIDNWPRRLPSAGQTTPQLRSKSDTHVVEDLRRRLALSGGSSSASLTSLSRQSFMDAPLPQVQNNQLSQSSKADNSVEILSSSQSTIRPSALPNKPWSRAGGFEVGRVSPAISSDSAIALGTMDMDIRSPHSEDNESSFSASLRRAPQQHITTTYEGNEPGVRILLERTFLETASEPMPDFGPRVALSASRKRATKAAVLSRSDATDTDRSSGVLLAQMVEHTAAIVAVAVSPDHVFFATGSEDGTVRVWDTARLEKKATSSSTKVIKHDERVTALCIVGRTHCLATASADGALKVHRIYVDSSSTTPRYGKAQRIRSTMIEPMGDYITCMACARHDFTSRLIYGTALGNIAEVDLQTMRTLSCLQNAPHLGPISALLVEAKGAWVLVGTSEGYLSLWDLRFRLLARTWKVADGAIHRLALHPARGKGRWVIVAAELDANLKTILQVWDIGRAQVVETFSLAARTSILNSQPSEMAKDARHSAADAISALLETEKEVSPTWAVYDVVVGIHASDLANSTRSSNSSVDAPRSSLAYLLSVGDDQKLRYWDLDHIERSTCLVGGAEEPEPSYETRSGSSITRHVEIAGRRSRKRPAKEALQEILKTPKDAILALGLLELPYPMIVTGDREGVVRVYCKR